MKVIAIDIECAQPENTIIQIGASVWDTQEAEKSESTKFDIHIDPGHVIDWAYPLRGGQTLEQLLTPSFRKQWDAHSILPEVALGYFWDWAKKVGGKKFIQWGTGDMACILKESKAHGIRVPDLRKLKVHNLKLTYELLFQSTCVAKGHRSGLGAAVEAFGLEFSGHAHDAFWDAYMTGELFIEMHRIVERQGQIMKLMNP